MGVRLLASTPEHVPMAVRMFPNATSFDARLISAPECQDGDGSEACLSNVLFDKVCQLKDLRDFSAWIKHCWQFTASPETSLKRLSKLERFDIVLHEKASSLSLLYSSLRFLTKLTMLYLYTPDMGLQQLDPFTELKNIKALGVNAHLLFNHEGQLLFPPSKQLKRLMINMDPSFRKYDDILEVLLPYACNLQALEFWWIKEHSDICFTATELLTCFQKLETLALTRQNAEPGNLFQLLRKMENLTHLDVRDINDTTTAPVDCIIAMTKLKTLLFLRPFIFDQAYIPAGEISQLTNLTRLAIDGYNVGSSLLHLTNLVDLEIYSPLEMSDGNFYGALPKLQRLLFDCSVTPVLASSDFLSQLRGLKHIGVYSFRNATNERLFEILAELTTLTLLRISFCDGEKWTEHMSSVTRLSDLLSLELSFYPAIHPSEYIVEGVFPRLRYLAVNIQELSDEAETELRRKLPGLHKIFVRRRNGEID